MDLRVRIIEALHHDEMHLQVREELQKEPRSKRYEDYRIEKDGILMHGGKMYIPWDTHEGAHDGTCVTEDKVRNRNYDSNCAEGGS